MPPPHEGADPRGDYFGEAIDGAAQQVAPLERAPRLRKGEARAIADEVKGVAALGTTAVERIAIVEALLEELRGAALLLERGVEQVNRRLREHPLERRDEVRQFFPIDDV